MISIFVNIFINISKKAEKTQTNFLYTHGMVVC